MSLPDSAHTAALQAEYIRPVFFAWIDIQGDPVRANTSGADVTPSGTGDPDLDGFDFIGITSELTEVSPVRYSQGGSQSVTAKLSGIPGLDDDTIAQLADPANWRGREARLWRVVRDAANVQQGGYHAYYTGRIVSLSHGGSATSQSITLTIEGYLSVFSEASNRTYLDQERYDDGDLSARASIAIANGNYTGALTGSGGATRSGPRISIGGGGYRFDV